MRTHCTGGVSVTRVLVYVLSYTVPADLGVLYTIDMCGVFGQVHVNTPRMLAE